MTGTYWPATTNYERPVSAQHSLRWLRLSDKHNGRIVGFSLQCTPGRPSTSITGSDRMNQHSASAGGAVHPVGLCAYAVPRVCDCAPWKQEVIHRSKYQTTAELKSVHFSQRICCLVTGCITDQFYFMPLVTAGKNIGHGKCFFVSGSATWVLASTWGLFCSKCPTLSVAMQ